MKQFLVWHEKGGYIHVFAESRDKAIDAFYEAIKGMIGHQLEICSCYGDKPLDRTKVIRPLRVEEYNPRTNPDYDPTAATAGVTLPIPKCPN